MSIPFNDWQAFLEDAPTRVSELIQGGPTPLGGYGGGSLNWADKRRGVLSFKGGTGSNVKTKRGMAAVVYFDPDFCEVERRDVPDKILENHSDSQVKEEFRKL